MEKYVNILKKLINDSDGYINSLYKIFETFENKYDLIKDEIIYRINREVVSSLLERSGYELDPNFRRYVSEIANRIQIDNGKKLIGILNNIDLEKCKNKQEIIGKAIDVVREKIRNIKDR